MPDDRGVLRTRLETLTSAMKKVGEAVETARQRAAGLRRANELLLEMLAPIGNVDRLVSDLGRAHDLGFLDLDEDEVKRVDGEFFEVLTRSADDVRSIWQKVMETRRTLQSIQDGMVNLSGDRKRIGDKIKIEIDQKCATVTSKIEQLTERLDEEGEEAAELWKQYRQIMDETVQPLFAAYVDFLGGIAVRDTALDGHICDLVDELISATLPHAPALSMPAHEAALSLSHVVKVGFPEWTVWSVPAAAHEIGLAFAHAELPKEGPGELAPFVGEDRLGTLEQVQHLLADAFGAYTLGPAYAHAMLELRLYPYSGHKTPDLPDDLSRAQVILDMLSHAAPRYEFDDYSGAVAELSDMWRLAVQVFLPQDPPDATPADTEVRRQFVAWAHGFLNGLGVPSSRDVVWENVTHTAALLLEDTVTRSVRPVDVNVVVLLNAAWRARTHKGADVEAIAGRVVELLPGNKQSQGRPSPRGAGKPRPSHSTPMAWERPDEYRRQQ